MYDLQWLLGGYHLRHLLTELVDSRFNMKIFNFREREENLRELQVQANPLVYEWESLP